MKRRSVTKAVAYGWPGLHGGLFAGCDGRDSPLRNAAPGDEDALLHLMELAVDLEGVDFVAPVRFRRVQSLVVQ